MRELRSLVARTRKCNQGHSSRRSKPRSVHQSWSVSESWKEVLETMRERSKTFPRCVESLLRNPIEPRYPGQVLQYWLARFSIISELRKVPLSLFWNIGELEETTKKKLCSQAKRRIFRSVFVPCFSPCNYPESQGIKFLEKSRRIYIPLLRIIDRIPWQLELKPHFSIPRSSANTE